MNVRQEDEDELIGVIEMSKQIEVLSTSSNDDNTLKFKVSYLNISLSISMLI